MSSEGPIGALILDLLEWIGPASRPYAEVMAAWRTSCPRLPVWEDANEMGFIARRSEPGLGTCIAVTARGREHLATHRGAPSRRSD
jgi:D-3-phosphoglycerate dehydrogenase